MADQSKPGDIIVIDSAATQWSNDEPTSHLRWSKAGVLQQAVIRREYQGFGNQLVAQDHVWRDIPTEE